MKTLTENVIASVAQKWAPSTIEMFACMHFQEVLFDGIAAFQRAAIAASESHKDLLLLIARGFGKSVWMTLIKASYAICSGQARGILICSHSMPEAMRRVRALKRAFEDRPTMCVMFGVQLGPAFKGKWSDEEIEFKVGNKLVNVWARGMKTQIRGLHPDLIIIDDPEETEGAKSAVVRAKVWDTFMGSIWPSLNPKTSNDSEKPPSVVIVGTSIHLECMVERIYNNKDNQFSSFHRMKFKGLEDGLTSDITGVSAGRSIWEGRWPTKVLYEMRKKFGERRFQSEIQCSPMPEGLQVWYPEFFDKSRYNQLPPNHYLITVTSVDPAKSITDIKHASQTGIVTLSREKFADAPNFYIRGAVGKHMTATERARTAVEHAVRYGAQWILVEDPAKKRSLRASAEQSDVAQLIRSEAMDLGVMSRFGITTVCPGQVWERRADHLIHLGEEDRICFPENIAGGVQELFDQLMTFPTGERTDLADAFHNGLDHLQNARNVRAAMDDDWDNRQNGFLSKRMLNGARNAFASRKGGWKWR